MTDFKNRNVLITGAASGIGRRVAEKAAGLGGRLILWDIDQENLDKTCADLGNKGGQVSAYVCDISDRKAIHATAEKVLVEHGNIDILINNAGIVSGKTILDAKDEEIIRTFDVNTLALFWMTRAFLPGMITQNSGHVVTIASAAGLMGTAKLTDYTASKYAAIGFDESLRLELRRQNISIRTTVVCPFYIDTGMFEGVKTRFSLLLPILKEDKVADKIIRAIQKNRRRLIMPLFIYSVFLCKLLPVPILDAIADFLGINKTMDEFTGRHPG